MTHHDASLTRCASMKCRRSKWSSARRPRNRPGLVSLGFRRLARRLPMRWPGWVWSARAGCLWCEGPDEAEEDWLPCDRRDLACHGIASADRWRSSLQIRRNDVEEMVAFDLGVL
jgi:hypothetical protein